MDGVCRTFGRTFATHFACIITNVCQIVFHFNGVVRANLKTFSTAGAGYRAIFLCNTALVFIDARNKNFAVFFELFTQFDDITRAGFHAGATGSAICIVYYRQICRAVHCQGVEFARHGAVAATETSVGAVGIARIKRVLNNAR